jgi:LruC domain-containing protein
MKNLLNKLCTISITLFLFGACDVLPEVEVDNTVTTEEIGSTLNIPDGFDFSTQQQVQITITDNESNVLYDVYAYSDEKYFAGTETFENQEGEVVTEDVYKSDVMNKLIFSGVPFNGTLTQTISMPTYYDKVYIRRNDNLKYASSIENIVNNEVKYSHVSTGKSVAGKSSAVDVVNDYLYCVNGAAQLFQVDPLNGELTDLSDMPMGSWTCAIDQENKTLYSIGRSSPFPLMKYTIDNNTWETVSNLGVGGPRLDFNVADGLLYFSKNDKLYTFDPATGANLNIWNIIGLHNVSGGDLAFAEDGTLFLCTFSGLYRLELDANNDYQSFRISADNLPFSPTSMTFDSNQELWLADNSSSADLIIMDTQTGGWQYQYGTSAGNNTDFGRTINDLTTFRVFSVNDAEIDTDGDGVLDINDVSPDNPDIAFEYFTPSKYGKGTVAFEDLWPYKGDYDFNDLALSYQAIVYLNAQNLAVKIDINCYVKSNGAGYTNGIGFEIEGLVPSQIESVTGPILVNNYINLNPNGTEANQDKAVIILTDDADYLLNETTVSINFTDPISTSALGVAPFNPFLIVDANREREVHLPYRNRTTLGVYNPQAAGVNSDLDGNYISDSGYPWAISIIHDFKVPKENVNITNAYNFFVSWAETGGLQFKDWYKDNPGYRNTKDIQN